MVVCKIMFKTVRGRHRSSMKEQNGNLKTKKQKQGIMMRHKIVTDTKLPIPEWHCHNLFHKIENRVQWLR